MRRIRICLWFCLLAWQACIKPYDPGIEGSDALKYVVSGGVTDTAGWQVVTVSRTSPMGSPEYLPVSGCTVEIRDDKGNTWPLSESRPGSYQGWLDDGLISPGTSCKVRVVLPGGDERESAYDRIPEGPPAGPVYYGIEDYVSADPGQNRKIMQFYTDLNGTGSESRFYRWELEETWEYQAAYPEEYYYDGIFHQFDPPDYTNYTCWITGPVKNVFTLSTVNMTQNKYTKFPLHFIDGKTSRLSILYSLLVKQMAISEGAYNYWDQMRINSNEQGGLYEKQPLAVRGNMINKTHPEQEVLGFFQAASVSSSRYFFSQVEGLPLEFDDHCYEEGLGKFGFKEFSVNDYPVYFTYVNGVVKILNRDCIDCRKAGGTTSKPDFWPR